MVVPTSYASPGVGGGAVSCQFLLGDGEDVAARTGHVFGVLAESYPVEHAAARAQVDASLALFASGL